MKKLLALLLAMMLMISTMTMIAVAEEPETYTMFAYVEPTDGPWKDDYMIQKIEKMFNINLEISEISNSVWNEKISIAFATDEYPEFFLTGLSGNDVQTYGSQGFLVDLKDYITEENTPNLYALYQQYPVAQRACMSYDGHQYSIQGYDRTNTREYLQGRFFVNTQWIENLGLDTPVTLDDFYQVLKAFKEQDANGNGDPNDEIPMVGAYSSDPYSLLTLPLAAYGYALGFPVNGNSTTYVDIDADGKVFFVPAAEHFKDALAWMQKLYAEELLDPEYFTQSSDQVNAKQSQMICGCYMDWAQWLEVSDPELYNQYDGITPLITDANPTPIWPAAEFMHTQAHFCITDKCKDIEKIIKIADWASTFDGYCTMMGGEEVGKMEGREDEGYEIEYLDESYGENALTLHYIHGGDWANDTEWRENGISPAWGCIPVWRADFTFVESSETEQALSAALCNNYVPYMKNGWPTTVKFTDSEWNTISLIATDLTNYIDQMVAKFITGEESLDDFDAFVQGLNDRGVAQYLEIYQTAYDRFMAN